MMLAIADHGKIIALTGLDFPFVKSVDFALVGQLARWHQRGAGGVRARPSLKRVAGSTVDYTAGHDGHPLALRQRMAQIFLSYTEKDRDAVRRLAQTLESVGWSVWWDRRIPAGLTWRSVLERELQSMRCMLVLWSSNSVQSDWVCEEAAEGRQLGRLVPVLIERVRPPAGFREVQAADLIDWDGARDFPGLQRLLEDIERLIGKPGPAPSQASQSELSAAPDDAAAPAGDASLPAPYAGSASPLPTPPARHPTWLAWAAASLVMLLAAASYFLVPWREPAGPVHALDQAPVPAAPPVVAATVTAPGASAPSATQPAAEVLVPAHRAGRGPDSAQRASARHVPLPSATSRRCAALQERLVLGETLSSESQLFLRQECQK